MKAEKLYHFPLQFELTPFFLKNAFFLTFKSLRFGLVSLTVGDKDRQELLNLGTFTFSNDPLLSFGSSWMFIALLLNGGVCFIFGVRYFVDNLFNSLLLSFGQSNFVKFLDLFEELLWFFLIFSKISLMSLLPFFIF